MEAAIVYPHQLFADSPALTKERIVYLVEEPLLLTHNPIHRQRLILHKLSMDAYQTQLETAGYTVTRLTIQEHPTTGSVFARLAADGVQKIHVVDTTDTYLEQAITKSEIERVWYESPLFILPKAEACERFTASKRLMASFYKQLRKDKQILIEPNGAPTGGKWSFDEDNRQKIPKGVTPPPDIESHTNETIEAAIAWTETVSAEIYGRADCWLPYTHAAAEQFVVDFLETRFHDFGPYEDAITHLHVRLWHSTLSPLLNIGLLTPQQVLDASLAYAKKHDVPINSLEGFVRQILGWREFIRASYEVDGTQMRNSNFFNHTRQLPASFWNDDSEITTGLLPVDCVITKVLCCGYSHHIERLMVMGNVMLLCQIHPDEVYRWFMGMYIDAYDWVMVPNVYGMSQFADGGSFATKPYIAGANYLTKMSDYPSDKHLNANRIPGDPESNWEATLTALYWYFIDTNKDVFLSNHRMSMMPRLLEKMDPDTRQQHLARAQAFLDTL